MWEGLIEGGGAGLIEGGGAGLIEGGGACGKGHALPEGGADVIIFSAVKWFVLTKSSS